MSPDEDKPNSPVDQAKKDTSQHDKDWQEQEDFLEESLEETFPGSDAISPGHPKKAGT